MDDVQRMAEQLRQGIVARQPDPILSGEVECDEVYVVAGHKGRPDAVKKKPSGSSALPEGRAGSGNLGEREATDFRDDPAGWSGGGADAGERPTGHDPSTDRAVHCSRNPRSH